MNKERITLIFSVVIVCLLTPNGLLAQNQTLNDWLSATIHAKVRARIDQRSNTKQTESPSQSTNSTSLVDQSSASDLLSTAINLVGLSNNSTGDTSSPKSVSVTASAYSVYALAKQQDPLDAEFYNKNAAWRRVSLTLGYDNENAQAAATTRATIAGFKVLLLDHRDLSSCPLDLSAPKFSSGHCSRQKEQFAQLQRATASFGKIQDQIAAYLWALPAARGNYQNLNEMLLHFSDVVKALGPAGQKDLDLMVDAQLQPFLDLDTATTGAIEQLRKAPQFSVSFTSTTRPGSGTTEYVAESIFDYGVANRINLTLNNTFDYKDMKSMGGIARGSKFVGDLQFQLTKEKRLTGRGPVTFDLSGEGDWMTRTSPTYEGQIKVKIPIAEGIDLPVSITFANRTDLIKERDVVGKFGFTFDTAKLLSFFTKQN
jgi:hypothetical protein